MEHARDLGLDLPVELSALLADLHNMETQQLRYITLQHDVKLQLASAIEAEDEQLLNDAIKQAKVVGVNSVRAEKLLNKLRKRARSTSSFSSDRETPGSARAGDDSDSESTHSKRCSRDDDAQQTHSKPSASKPSTPFVPSWRRANSSASAPGVPPWRQANGAASRPHGTSRTSAEPGTVWERGGAVAKGGKPVTSRNEALKLLGFPANACPSDAEVKAAYRRAALEAHPDRIQNHQRQEDAKAMFQSVQQAFDILQQRRNSMTYVA
eukprot:gnl/MRDRNA2_/MRDRNA2_19041_c0_seq1.p1 gnl/MRDRNA2_/MRDRNA2_19041_c0~~gnl/MRDRNA2_/MRDRNA2_19041_c0_seq1.p1  ORF type:complete len:267 (-),score=51.27 gnl/MRDRNA2_/MRDRNA2_19041_c0_seq1:181-981(-)